MNESCHIWMSHVIHEWVVSHMNESCHTWMSRVTYEWVMSYMNESCHIWMSHVIHECLVWIWMRHIAYIQSCHIWMSHVACNESCHIPFVLGAVLHSSSRARGHSSSRAQGVQGVRIYTLHPAGEDIKYQIFRHPTHDCAHRAQSSPVALCVLVRLGCRKSRVLYCRVSCVYSHTLYI